MIIWNHYLGNYRITSFCTMEQMMLLIIHQGESWMKLLSWRHIYSRNYRNCKITISTPIKRQDHGKASLSVSIVDNFNIRAFYLNGGGFHLSNKGLRRLAIYLKVKICHLWYKLEPINDDHEKEMLNENTTNFQSQKSLTYKFSSLDQITTEEEDVKSSLRSLKLRNVNRLIFGQINISSIRKNFKLLFSLVSNNIDVLLISKTKIDNTFLVSRFCAPGYSAPFRFHHTGNGRDILLYVKKHIPCRTLIKFFFEKSIEAFAIKIILRKVMWLLICSYNQIFF